MLVALTQVSVGAATLLLAAEESEGGGGVSSSPIWPAANELFWGIISFGALYLLVNFVLLPPVQRIRNDRAATIQADKDAAALARSKVASASAEVEDQLSGVRAEAQAVIDEARAEAEAERQRLVGRAEREVNAMRELATSEIASEREEALASLRPQVADLAVGAASRVTGRQMQSSTVRSKVDQYLTNPSNSN